MVSYGILSILPLFLMSGGGFFSPEPVVSDAALVRPVFERVAARLQTGGTLYHIDFRQDRLSTAVNHALAILREVGIEDEDANRIFTGLPDFLEDSGVYSLQGVGASAVPRPDGLLDARIFLAVSAESHDSPWWRAWLGEDVFHPGRLRFFPPETDAVLACNFDTAALWQMIEAAVLDVGLAGDREAWQEMLEAWAESPMPPQTVLQSLTGQVAVGLLLNREQVLPLPLGPRPATVPAPDFLLVVETRDNRFAERLTAILEAEWQSETRVMAGQAVRVFQPPANQRPPWPFALSILSLEQELLMASTPEIIGKALTAAVANHGLPGQVEFAEAFQGSHLNYRGLFFVSAQAVAEYNKLRETIRTQAAGASELAMLSMLLPNLPEAALSGRAEMVEDGILLTGVGTGYLPRALAKGGSLSSLPLWMGMIIPSLYHSRTRAQEVSCIHNRRMLYAAKMQFVIDSGQAAAPTFEDVLPYLDQMPTCPQGGVYSLNDRDEPVSCSVHGGL